MSSIKATKRIGSTGDSLIIPVTREAKEFGLEKGDEMTIIIQDPSEDENHDYEFACMLSNPNAAYVNSRPLTPDDTLMDGSPIPARDESVDDELRVKFSSIIRTQYQFYDILRDFVRGRIDNDSVRYSDTMRSFIVEFYPTTFVDRDLQNVLDQISAMYLLKELVERSCVHYSSLESVSSLIDHMAEAYNDVLYLYDHMIDEDKDEIIQELNKTWKNKISGKMYPDMWYVAVTAAFLIDDEYPDSFGTAEFGVYEAPCPQYVYDMLSEQEPDDYRRHAMVDRIVLGPYQNQDDAQDMMSYFRMSARSNNWTVDQEFTRWCKNESNRIMGV